MVGKKVKKAAKAERKQEKKAAKVARLGPKGAGGLLPKTLAGVKVPQALRQSGSALAEFATSDLGRAVLVAALTAAADTLLRHRPGEDKAPPATAKDVVQNAALAAAGVVKDAAKTVLPPALLGEAGARDRPDAAERKGAKA